MVRKLKRSSGEETTEFVHVDAARLFRLGPKHQWWSEIRVSRELTSIEVGGAFVWLEPPHDAQDAAIYYLRDEVMRLGAVAARILERAPGPDVVARVPSQRTAYTESDMERVAYQMAEEVDLVDQETLRDYLREAFEAARN